jgi:indole-3-glycerol phosphate synthase
MTTQVVGASADLLATIVAATRRIIEVRSEAVPLAQVERRAGAVHRTIGSFRGGLSREDRVNIIAECKRRSPSRGVLRNEYDAAAIARSYAAHGAAAISVLTEPTFFDGSLDDLAAVRSAVDVPLLRKDFIVDRYQILEARAAGADAVLLIVAALPPLELAALHRQAEEAGLDVLVEIHDVEELAPAIDAGARMIGVNNRNLRTLAVNTEVSEAIVARLPRGVIAVAESGLKTPDDVSRLRRAGYHAFLIGERFMASEDPGSALGQLLAGVAV